jgi:hypothetical protein
MNTVSRFTVSLIIAFTMAASGCGGGSGGGGGQAAGIGGTGKIASGTVTGFGSIILTDGEYDIDNATCNVDDQDTSAQLECGLEIGMVVTVTASSFDDATRTGVATSVLHDDDVEGPVAGLIPDGTTQRFTVLGVTVVVDAASTEFDDSFAGFNFDSIADNDVVEVSGLFDANGVLNATYIEKKGVLVPNTTQVELKGTVSNAGSGAGEGDSFTVNGINVTIDIGADLSDVPGGVVMDGMFVEAKGVFVNAGQVNAFEVEVEDDVIGDDEDDVSIEGIISEFNGINDFKVSGQAVNASSATLEPATLQLGDGLRVEVEGPIISGVLVAEEVEAEGGDIKVNATVSSVLPANNTVTLTLGSIPNDLTAMSTAWIHSHWAVSITATFWKSVLSRTAPVI